MAMTLLALPMGMSAAPIVVGIVSNLLDQSESLKGSYMALSAPEAMRIYPITMRSSGIRSRE